MVGARSQRTPGGRRPYPPARRKLGAIEAATLALPDPSPRIDFRLVADLAARIPSWVGTLEARSARRTVLTVSGDSETTLVALMLHADVPFVLLDPPGLAPALEAAAQRLLAGIRKPALGH